MKKLIFKYSPNYLITFIDESFLIVNENTAKVFESAQDSGDFTFYLDKEYDGDQIINISPIELKADISLLTQDEKEQLSNRCKVYTKKLNKLPTSAVVEKWINKIRKGQSIFIN